MPIRDLRMVTLVFVLLFFLSLASGAPDTKHQSSIGKDLQHNIVIPFSSSLSSEAVPLTLHASIIILLKNSDSIPTSVLGSLLQLRECLRNAKLLKSGLGTEQWAWLSLNETAHAEAKLNSRQKLNQLLFSKIREDLAPWQDRGITIQQVERTYCTLFEGGFVDGGFRVQVCLRTSLAIFDLM